MIEVFKTNVQDAADAKEFADILMHQFPGCKVNFDLDDCDKVLRINGANFDTDTIISLLQSHNCQCKILD